MEKSDFKDFNVLIFPIFNDICKLLSNKFIYIFHKHGKNHEVPENDQELRPKHFGAINNK
jgi:hypothetical protein